MERFLQALLHHVRGAVKHAGHAVTSRYNAV